MIAKCFGVRFNMTQGVPQGVCVCSTYPAYKGTPKIQKKTKQKLQKIYMLQFFEETISYLKKALTKKEQNETELRPKNFMAFL